VGMKYTAVISHDIRSPTLPVVREPVPRRSRVPSRALVRIPQRNLDVVYSINYRCASDQPVMNRVQGDEREKGGSNRKYMWDKHRAE